MKQTFLKLICAQNLLYPDLKWLLTKYFLLQISENDELDWPVLKDILVNLVVSEDCALGLSLILTEFSRRESVVTQEILEDPRMAPYVLYLASLAALWKKIGAKTFQISPGLLYACARALNSKKCLDSELFESALAIAEVEWSDS